MDGCSAYGLDGNDIFGTKGSEIFRGGGKPLLVSVRDSRDGHYSSSG